MCLQTLEQTAQALTVNGGWYCLASKKHIAVNEREKTKHKQRCAPMQNWETMIFPFVHFAHKHVRPVEISICEAYVEICWKKSSKHRRRTMMMMVEVVVMVMVVEVLFFTPKTLTYREMSPWVHWIPSHISVRVRPSEQQMNISILSYYENVWCLRTEQAQLCC